MLSAIAPAKVNLFLHLLGKRSDGYHDLQSVFVFLKQGDEVSLEPAANLSLTVEGPHAAELPAEKDNLVYRVLERAMAQSGQGARLRLVKHLPVASGLGGGSSDAATALRLYDEMLGQPRHAAPEWLAEIGADLPACYLAQSCWVEGKGERLSPLPDLPRLSMLLVNPRIALSTAAIFAGGPGFSAPVAQPDTAWGEFLAAQRNDLQPVATRLAPEIANVIAALEAQPGCTLARMSGSGATCFGLFDEPATAQAAARRLEQSHPHWWIMQGESNG